MFLCPHLWTYVQRSSSAVVPQGKFPLFFQAGSFTGLGLTKFFTESCPQCAFKKKSISKIRKLRPIRSEISDRAHVQTSKQEARMVNVFQCKRDGVGDTATSHWRGSITEEPLRRWHLS